MDYQFNLSPEDIPSRQQKVTALLDRLETATAEKLHIDFPRLKSRLDYFPNIKATTDLNEIIQFLYGILTALDLWSPDILRDFFTYIFPPRTI